MTLDPLRAAAAAWLAARRPAVVVTVTESRGSAPRGAGTRMLVAADALAGTIGGGRLEWEAIAHARRLLAARPPTAPATGGAVEPGIETEQRIALGPSLGQCCGGVVRLGYEPLAASVLERWADAVPLFALQLHGAGHVGRALVRVLRTLPCALTWVDSREDAFGPGTQPSSPDEPARIGCLATDAPQDEVARAAPSTSFVIMTHSHALDYELVLAALTRGDAAFVGLIGSATKRARFEHRLRARGMSDAVIERLECPIGVPGIAGKAPEVIAIAVAARLLQVASAQR